MPDPPSPTSPALGVLASALAELLALAGRVAAVEATHDTQALAIQALAQKIATLEDTVSQTEDAIADLNNATNDLAARIDAILAREASLDSTTAGELQQVSTRLKGLAADPAQPVPADGGDVTPPAEPTP